MSQKKIRESISFIKQFLKKRHIKVTKIILFGSYAHGHPTKDSDVDIAIVSEDFNKKDIFERSRSVRGLGWELVSKFQAPFDIAMISLREWKDSSSLIVSFVKQGKEL